MTASLIVIAGMGWVKVLENEEGIIPEITIGFKI
jgi:hypothetical protein